MNELELDALKDKVVDAVYDNDIETLRDIFINKRLLDIKEKTKNDNWSYLHRALLYFKPTAELVKFYLDNGLEVNAQDGYGMTPLHYAMQSENPDAALVLLDAGADQNIPNIDNIIPLTMIGGMPDRLDILEKMLKQGGNVHHLNGRNARKTVLESYQARKDKGDDIRAIYEMMLRYA